ncbi:hypothetical protein PR048_023881 [Dryococelus australis]|uniref:Uncharacterized protein n=1 Tax=Dryococelus australis TaxID=614101 RepID=A0ABQ9GVD5_9NEOP|nr:hypothetical protein PR048_023881 [Dryococelus australis]
MRVKRVQFGPPPEFKGGGNWRSPRKSPLVSDVVRHNSHTREYGSDLTGNRTRLKHTEEYRPDNGTPSGSDIQKNIAQILRHTEEYRPDNGIPSGSDIQKNIEEYRLDNGIPSGSDIQKNIAQIMVYHNYWEENRVTPARAFFYQQGEPSTLPDGVTLEFSPVEIVLDDVAGRRVSSGISRSPTPAFLHIYTLIDSQDHMVKAAHYIPLLSTINVKGMGGLTSRAPLTKVSQETTRQKNAQFANKCACMRVFKSARFTANSLYDTGGLTNCPRWRRGSVQGLPSHESAGLPPRRSGFTRRPAHSGFPHVGIVPDEAVGRRVFSGISRFPALSFRRCPILASITLIGSQDLDLVGLSLIGERRSNKFAGQRRHFAGACSWATQDKRLLHLCTVMQGVSQPPTNTARHDKKTAITTRLLYFQRDCLNLQPDSLLTRHEDQPTPLLLPILRAHHSLDTAAATHMLLSSISPSLTIHQSSVVHQAPKKQHLLSTKIPYAIIAPRSNGRITAHLRGMRGNKGATRVFSRAQISRRTRMSNYHWLLCQPTARGPEDVRDVFRDVDIPFDCEFVVASGSGDGGVVLTEVYRLAPNLSLRWDHFGHMESRQGPPWSGRPRMLQEDQPPWHHLHSCYHQRKCMLCTMAEVDGRTYISSVVLSFQWPGDKKTPPNGYTALYRLRCPLLLAGGWGFYGLRFHNKFQRSRPKQIARGKIQASWKPAMKSLVTSCSATNPVLRQHLLQVSAMFHTNGKVNRHNARIWSQEHPHETTEHERASPKVNVFCAVSKDKVFSPSFIHEPTVTGLTYLDMVTEWLFPQLEEAAGDFIFQQDSAPSHWHLAVRGYLNDMLPQRWSPRSPDLTPCHFFLW